MSATVPCPLGRTCPLSRLSPGDGALGWSPLDPTEAIAPSPQVPDLRHSDCKLSPLTAPKTPAGDKQALQTNEGRSLRLWLGDVQL